MVVSTRHINVIKYAYNGAITIVRTTGDNTSKFPITIGLHYRYALCPYPFTLVMDEFTRHFQNDIP